MTYSRIMYLLLGEGVIAAVHVDDFLSVASDKSDEFKEQMRKDRTISDLGKVKVAVDWDRPNNTVTLDHYST